MKSNLYLTLHNLYISSHILHTVLDIYPKSWQWEFVMKSRSPWVRDHFLILMTLMIDSRVILYGEIRCYSFLGVRGLRKVWIHEVSPFLGTHNLPLEWIKARFSQQVDQLLPWKSAGVDERVFRFVIDRFVSALKAVLFFFRRLAKEKGKSVKFMPNKEPTPITVALPWIDQEYCLYPPGGIQVYVTPLPLPLSTSSGSSSSPVAIYPPGW